MADFTYPSNSILQLTAAELLPRTTVDDPIFRHFPIEYEDTDLIMWERKDRITGLPLVRGLNGQPHGVQQIGDSRFQMTPGYYGEFATVDEAQLTRARMPGSYSQPLDISAKIAELQAQLMGRQMNLVSTVLWTLLSTGTVSVLNKQGIAAYSEAYTFQTQSGSAWATPATGTPLADFRATTLKGRGYSVRFDSSATAYMNRVTFNYWAANTNSADLFGKRTSGLATVQGVNEINTVLTQEDLPNIKIWDDGYINSAGTFVPFLANNKTVIVGRRTDNAAIGGYKITRNANRSDFGAGMYSYVADSIATMNPAPRRLDVHLGHNGGPVVYYPSAVVTLTTT